MAAIVELCLTSAVVGAVRGRSGGLDLCGSGFCQTRSGRTPAYGASHQTYRAHYNGFVAGRHGVARFAGTNTVRVCNPFAGVVDGAAVGSATGCGIVSCDGALAPRGLHAAGRCGHRRLRGGSRAAPGFVEARRLAGAGREHRYHKFQCLVKTDLSHSCSVAQAVAAIITGLSAGSGSYDRSAPEAGYSRWRGHGLVVNVRSGAEPTGTSDPSPTFALPASALETCHSVCRYGRCVTLPKNACHLRRILSSPGAQRDDCLGQAATERGRRVVHARQYREYIDTQAMARAAQIDPLGSTWRSFTVDVGSGRRITGGKSPCASPLAESATVTILARVSTNRLATFLGDIGTWHGRQDGARDDVREMSGTW
ncbi:hypothetical protein E5CHR_04391 [Variovorax sp. PBL-E5]|nr:hypothetical protein E5CHR_04391 [Variovorax sp. PBL-E5]